jgi:hypothetical protein
VRNVLTFDLLQPSSGVWAGCMLLVLAQPGLTNGQSDRIAIAGYVDSLLWHVWKCMDMYDQGAKLGMRRQRNSAEDSAAIKGKRPDFCFLSSKALLFKGEDTKPEFGLEKAIEELSTKLKDWGAAVHGQVLQANSPYCLVA